jgi:hypothetical protein
MDMNKKQPAGKRKTSPGKKRTSTTRSSHRLTRDDMAALAQLDHLLELQRRREQLAASVPPGIETTQEMLTNGTVLYHFTHEELGALGVLRIAPVPYMVPLGMTHVSAEMEPADPDQDAQWNQKYTLFKEMVTLCISALPASNTVSSPLPSLEEARAGRRLYLRFLDCLNDCQPDGPHWHRTALARASEILERPYSKPLCAYVTLSTHRKHGYLCAGSV